ncbi:hypothetical protein O181_028491 [Austropuccinia psidii MF-1]|uniref:Uncharacterized protein n=1 Tax=Austropuccinia psidii MF-1 TaxID=1389203 RepID=A0A9Q3CP92_9BASI|nr:hypothetical protein [Austropuccinia psidii MF-1]
MASRNPTPTAEQVSSGGLSMEQVLLSIIINKEKISLTIGMLREDVDKLKISPPPSKKAMANTSQTPHQELRNEAIPAHSQSEPPVSKVTPKKKPTPTVEPYDLKDKVDFVKDEEDKNGSEAGSIYLEAPSENEGSESDDGLYAPGEYNYEDDDYSKNEGIDEGDENEQEEGIFKTQDEMKVLEHDF